MLSCKQATEYVIKAEEKKLSVLQRLQLWQHLAVCVLCKRFRIQNSSINTLVASGFVNEDEKLSEKEQQEILIHVKENTSPNNS